MEVDSDHEDTGRPTSDNNSDGHYSDTDEQFIVSIVMTEEQRMAVEAFFCA